MRVAKIDRSNNHIVAIEICGELPKDNDLYFHIETPSYVCAGDRYNEDTNSFSSIDRLVAEQSQLDGYGRTERYKRRLREEGRFLEALQITIGRR